LCPKKWGHSNGLFNDIDTITKDNFFSDKILIGEYGNKVISSDPAAGATRILPETLIPINGEYYAVKYIEATGKYIKIYPTGEQSVILTKGDILPNFDIEYINGDKTTLYNVLSKNKYNLIDCWAFWCKPCLESISDIKRLDSVYKDKINIIGLHDWRNKKGAEKAIKKYNIQYKTGFLTIDIEKIILAPTMFPYYVLLDKNGKVVKFNMTLDELEDILKK